MKYIDVEKLIHDLEERIYAYSEGYANGDNYRKDAIETLLKDVKYQLSLQQEYPKIDLENKFGWHNIPEKTPEFGDTIIVACKNKNKEDGIWLYDLIQCWEGKWEPRENWETPLKWISVDELGLNVRKEK